MVSLHLQSATQASCGSGRTLIHLACTYATRHSLPFQQEGHCALSTALAGRHGVQGTQRKRTCNVCTAAPRELCSGQKHVAEPLAQAATRKAQQLMQSLLETMLRVRTGSASFFTQSCCTDSSSTDCCMAQCALHYLIEGKAPAAAPASASNAGVQKEPPLHRISQAKGAEKVGQKQSESPELAYARVAMLMGCCGRER